MATPAAHDVVYAELPLYVVGAVDPIEAADIEAHLAECLDCRLDAARLRDAAALLAPTDRRDLDACWEHIVSAISARPAS